MANLQKFYNLYKEYKDIANFVIVYVAEAHANDSYFTIPGNVDIATATKLDDRIEACKQLVNIWREKIDDKDEYDEIIVNNDNSNDKNKIKFLIDNMNDDMHKRFIARPERLYAVETYKVVYQGRPGPFGYNLDDLKSFLSKYRQKNQ